MSKETYLCSECKHSFVKFSDKLLYMFDLNNKYRYTCRRSFKQDTIEHNPVTGPEKKRGGYSGCTMCRIGTSNAENCGVNAYYWEPRDKKGLFKLIIKESNV